ncbi:TPM domain-containing protein, partial [Schumannella sp. 10F1B-5-1]
YLSGGDIDAVVKAAMVPKFRGGDFVAGIEAGADALVDTYLGNKATNTIRTGSRASGSSSSSTRSFRGSPSRLRRTG